MSCRWHQNNAENDLPSPAVSAKGEESGRKQGGTRTSEAGRGGS